MDQDGLFLMLKMCNGCSHNKGSWKKCMSRRHNPRMSTVRKEELTFGHRQCVKPDQPITIYKLRDHETNEEFLEFDEAIIFQTACSDCLNIKSCINSGHKLVDWRPTFAGGRVAGTPAPPAAQKITPGSGGGGGGGGGGNRKSRGGGTPTRPKGSKGKAAAAAAGAGEGVGEGRNASVAGRKGGRGGAAAAGDDTSEGNAEGTASPPKPSHKRKSPGAGGSAVKFSNSKDIGEPSVQNGKPAGRRGGRGNPAPVGGAKRGRRRSSAEDVDMGTDDATKMEIETESSGVGERPLKRRGRGSAPAVVTPSPKAMYQDSFETSSPGDGDSEGGEVDGAASNGDDCSPTPAPPSPPPPPVPKTVAEKLELVKSEEAELLRQFGETHKRSAQKEKAKREEMAEFQRAGEAALRAIQEEKEEVLCRISEERMKKAAECQKLVQQRLKEFEAEEEASRVEARERDARLEAEKERLAKASRGGAARNGSGKAAADAPNGNGTGTDNGTGNGEWTADSWTLSGANSAELKRVAAQKARRAGQGAAAKKPAFVKDEKTCEQAAAVAKLLAGTAVDGGIDGGCGGGRETADGGVSEEQASGAAAEDVDDEAKAQGASEEQEPAVVVPASAGEEGDGSPPANGETSNGGGEATAAAPQAVARDASVSSASASAMQVGDGKSSLPDTAATASPTSVDGGAKPSKGGDGGSCRKAGGVAVSEDKGVSNSAAATVQAEVEANGAAENGNKEGPSEGGAAEGVAAPGMTSQ